MFQLTDSSFQSNFLRRRPSEKVEKAMRRWQRPWAGWERRVEDSFTQEEEGSVTEVQEGEEVVEEVEEVGSEGSAGATSSASTREVKSTTNIRFHQQQHMCQHHLPYIRRPVSPFSQR